MIDTGSHYLIDLKFYKQNDFLKDELLLDNFFNKFILEDIQLIDIIEGRTAISCNKFFLKIKNI